MAQKYPHLHFVILAEDCGTRLWPITREQAPACFAPAESGGDESLLSAAVGRARPFTDCPLHIVTTRGLSELICGELASRSGLFPGDFDLLALPEEHGTTFSVAVASARIRRQDPDAIVAVLRADQYMVPDERWERLLYHAYLVALRDLVAVIGGEQREKCADLSYIRLGKQLEAPESAYETRAFVAGAPASAAQRAVDAGACWYAGIFMARASVLMRVIGRADDHDGGGGLGTARIAEAADFFAMLEPEALMNDDAGAIIDALPAEDLEPAVLARTEGLIAIPTPIGFETLGTLSDLDGLGEPDERGNRLAGNALAVETAKTTVVGQGRNRLIATFGLSETLVVDTPDALLVADKRRLRDMGKVLDALREAEAPQLVQSARRSFPWGSATLLSSRERVAVWELSLRNGASVEGQSVPVELGGPDAAAPREQYVVAAGSVRISAHGEGAELEEPVRMDAGDAFESDPGDPLTIACVGDAPASLVLTMVLA